MLKKHSEGDDYSGKNKKRRDNRTDSTAEVLPCDAPSTTKRQHVDLVPLPKLRFTEGSHDRG